MPIRNSCKIFVPPGLAPEPHRVGNLQGRVGAVDELDGDEDELGVAGVLEVVDLGLARSVALVLRLAGEVALLDRRAVLHARAPAPGRDGGPEVIEHVAVEADALAGPEADLPDAHALGLGDQARADAAVVAGALELARHRLRPRPAVDDRSVIHLHGSPPSRPAIIDPTPAVSSARSCRSARARSASLVFMGSGLAAARRPG